MLEALLIVGAVTLAYFVVARILGWLVHPDPPPRWQIWWRERRRRAEGLDPATPDPFDVLRVQQRLGRVSAQLQEFEPPSYTAASGHKLLALRAAYDDLLDEACTLAGVPPQPDLRTGDERRRYEEQELIARGWTW